MCMHLFTTLIYIAASLISPSINQFMVLVLDSVVCACVCVCVCLSVCLSIRVKVPEDCVREVESIGTFRGISPRRRRAWEGDLSREHDAKVSE